MADNGKKGPLENLTEKLRFLMVFGDHQANKGGAAAESAL